MNGDHFEALAKELKRPWPNTLRSLHLEYLLSESNSDPLPSQRELARMWGINGKTLRSWFRVRELPTNLEEHPRTGASTVQHLQANTASNGPIAELARTTETPAVHAQEVAPEVEAAPVAPPEGPAPRPPVPAPDHLYPSRKTAPGPAFPKGDRRLH